MRVNVVFDDQGTILAASEVGDGGDSPVVKEDEYAGEFDMPQELAGAGLQGFVENFVVDMKGNRLMRRPEPGR